MRLWCLLWLSALAVSGFANPILVRWDEFAICLRRRLKRQFSPNVICATRKMASNFRRSLRCPSCEQFFHCQANYEAVFHCSQAPEAIHTAEVISDCREYAQLGGPAAGTLSDRQEANVVGRRGGDCVGEFLTKATEFNLASILTLRGTKKCQWNPFESRCDSAAGEVIASADYPSLLPSTQIPQTSNDYGHANNIGFSSLLPFSFASLINLTQPLFGLNKKPSGTEKAQNLLETLQVLNTVINKLPPFPYESNESMAKIKAHSAQNISKPVIETKPPGIPVSNSDSSGDSSHESVVDDPLFGSIASAFGSFFGKPPVLNQNENQTTIISSYQRPQPVVIPLKEDVHSHSTEPAPQTSSCQGNQKPQTAPKPDQGESSKQTFLFPSSRKDA